MQPLHRVALWPHHLRLFHLARTRGPCSKSNIKESFGEGKEQVLEPWLVSTFFLYTRNEDRTCTTLATSRLGYIWQGTALLRRQNDGPPPFPRRTIMQSRTCKILNLWGSRPFNDVSKNASSKDTKVTIAYMRVKTCCRKHFKLIIIGSDNFKIRNTIFDRLISLFFMRTIAQNSQLYSYHH